MVKSYIIDTHSKKRPASPTLEFIPNSTMPFSITAPAPQPPIAYNDASDSDTDDSEGDIDMGPPAKRPKLSTKSIVTPGETVTDDPQWMRCSLPLNFQIKLTKLNFSPTEVTAPTPPLPRPRSSPPSPVLS